MVVSYCIPMCININHFHGIRYNGCITSKIVCGFPGYELSNKITILNYVISVICYTIFKSNSRSKFEETSYQNMSLQAEIKKSIMYYNHSICSKSISESTFFRNIMYYFQEEFWYMYALFVSFVLSNIVCDM